MTTATGTRPLRLLEAAAREALLSSVRAKGAEPILESLRVLWFDANNGRVSVEAIVTEEEETT